MKQKIIEKITTRLYDLPLDELIALYITVNDMLERGKL